MTIPYGKQAINQDDIDAVVAVLNAKNITQGPQIGLFEAAFSTYVGAKYAVAVSSGTAALHLACLAMGTNANSTVISTPISFLASANCVLYCAGNIEFIDVDANVLLDIDRLETMLAAAKENTYQGIIPVQFAGACVDLQRLRKICDAHGMWIIEDACHSLGGYFLDADGNQQKSGNGQFADISVFSFHPVKHITTGEGGMLTTNNEQLYQKLIALRSHGIKQTAVKSTQQAGWLYEMHDLGYNYRITDIQCALGISQLKRAPNSLQKRQQIAKKYDQAFDAMGLKYLPNKAGQAYHLYIILSEYRKDLYDYLRSKDILVQVHYIPIHYQPYYQQLGWKNGDFADAETYYGQCLSLPMYPTLTSAEQDYVIQQIQFFYHQKSVFNDLVSDR